MEQSQAVPASGRGSGGIQTASVGSSEGAGPPLVVLCERTRQEVHSLTLELYVFQLPELVVTNIKESREQRLCDMNVYSWFYWCVISSLQKSTHKSPKTPLFMSVVVIFPQIQTGVPEPQSGHHIWRYDVRRVPKYKVNKNEHFSDSIYQSSALWPWRHGGFIHVFTSKQQQNIQTQCIMVYIHQSGEQEFILVFCWDFWVISRALDFRVLPKTWRAPDLSEEWWGIQT